MNKQELEKMFDKKLNGQGLYCDGWSGEKCYCTTMVKNFIFETVIPEVLRSIMMGEKDNGDIVKGFTNEYIKHKAKELYNINL